ncbi:MAG TPA: hypothetical protein DCO73_02305 [Alphaproteobacteria bacterium]|nr:hypothetical protein [Alphaproteobacteria bacterium]
MRKIPLRWRWAAFLAAGLHLVPLAMIIWQPVEINGAQLPGNAGIAVALAPAGRAPGDPDPQPETEQANAPATASEADPAPENTEAEIAEIPDQPQPDPPVTTPSVKPSKPVTKAVKPPANKPHQPIAEKADNAPAPATQLSGAAGNSGDRDSDETGNVAADPSDSGGGDPGVKADYMAVLRAWLETHKKYPRRAQMRRQEGTALLFFIVDENGKVIEFKLRQSSGYAALDHEVTEMLKRAEPLPRIPPEMQKAQLSLLVPVQFYLR